MEKPVVSVVLGSYNRLKFLKSTIKSIREELQRLNLPAEIIVVEGGSTDGSLKWLIQQKDIITIVQHNRGFWQGKPIKRRSWGYFMNLGFKCAQGKYICMLSDDCLLIPNAIVNGYAFFEKQLNAGIKMGALAFYWRNIPFFYSDWTKEKTYVVLYTPFNKQPFVNHGMYLKKALEEVNYIDEENYTFYYADADLCLRLEQHGYICGKSPDSYVEHYLHALPSLKQKNSQFADEDMFFKKWNARNTSFETKEFDDQHHTVKKFTYAHITNLGLWIPFCKGVIQRKIQKLFNPHKIHHE